MTSNCGRQKINWKLRKMTTIKVAAYCRVSTNHEDQLNSFSSHQSFFGLYIRQHPMWELYEIYADEGITGTSTKKRLQFNRMIADAHERKFNLVITKEVSRFSRNILDTITYTRELKALGIGVVFMSDGFCSTDPDAELRLSIMGSIAQEESRKTSGRVKWGHTRQMERGVVFGHSLLGYRVKNGILEIEPVGAEVVTNIFHMYGVEQKSAASIARTLCKRGIRTSTGNPLWSDSQVLKILKNEKYVGDLVQKKTITPDYLTHERKYNHGEEERIILKDHHEPIVSRELWDLVQSELQKRRRCGGSAQGHSNRYVFSGKIICGECGSTFISRMKKRSNGSSYRRWGCQNAVKYGARKQGGLGCDVGKLIPDDLAISMILAAVKSIPMNRLLAAQSVVKAIPQNHLAGKTVSQQPHRIRKRLEAAVDAYLSDTITKEELESIKLQHRTEITGDTTENNRDQWLKIAEEILSCQRVSEIFLKSILESMTVHKGGHVTLRLKKIPAVWHFNLYLSGCLFP